VNYRMSNRRFDVEKYGELTDPLENCKELWWRKPSANRLATSHIAEIVSMTQASLFSYGVSQRNMSAHDAFDNTSTMR